MRNAAIYILAVFICLASGYMAGLLQATALEEWYPTLAKSSLTPPNLMFPIAWGILYVCIGVSLGETIRCGNIRAIAPWVLQLIANFLWTVFFFWLRNPLLALIDILLLDVLVIWYIVAASVVFQKVCLGRRLQILQICKYSDSWFRTTRRGVLFLFLCYSLHSGNKTRSRSIRGTGLR